MAAAAAASRNLRGKVALITGTRRLSAKYMSYFVRIKPVVLLAGARAGRKGWIEWRSEEWPTRKPSRCEVAIFIAGSGCLSCRLSVITCPTSSCLFSFLHRLLCSRRGEGHIFLSVCWFEGGLCEWRRWGKEVLPVQVETASRGHRPPLNFEQADFRNESRLVLLNRLVTDQLIFYTTQHIVL